MIKKSSFKFISIIMCILILCLISSVFVVNNYNTVYADNNEQIKLTYMQKAFFEIAELKDKNNNLSKNDINEITDKFTLESTKKRKMDVVNTYVQKSDKKDKTEKLCVFRSLDNDLRIEGIIYCIYNPNKNVNVIRMQYHDVEEDNKYIRLEITTENINNIDTILNKFSPQVIKSELYSNYKNVLNEVKSNNNLNDKDLKSINNEFKEVNNKSSNSSSKQFEIRKGEKESLLIDIDNSSNKLRNMYYDFGVNKGKYQDCLNMISIENLDQKDIEYYNLSPNSNFANTLMIFKNNALELKEIFLQYK